jgi:hypothetical protein
MLHACSRFIPPFHADASCRLFHAAAAGLQPITSKHTGQWPIPKHLSFAHTFALSDGWPIRFAIRRAAAGPFDSPSGWPIRLAYSSRDGWPIRRVAAGR